MNATNLRDSLLTVHFSISAWEGRKQDKKATKEVADTHGTQSSVGRYHKDLLPGAVEHEKILSIRNGWRTWHYEQTLPWGDEGARVMRSAKFMDYGEGYRNWEAQWTHALQAFEVALPTLIAQAELRLNTLFNRADYPDADEIMKRFAVRLRTYPLPNGEDFRVMDGIPPEEVERLVAEAEDGINARLGDAVKDLWTRMHTVVSHMQAKLADPKGRFHDTLVSNVQDLVDLMPCLNLTNDPVLAQMGLDMADLSSHSPEALRSQVGVREAAAAKAAALVKRMGQYV
jgi:hypothetical protein